MKPAEFDEFTRSAFMALSEGVASEGQQKHALEFLLFNLCGIRNVSFDAASERLSAFKEGSRFVGLQVAGMISPEGAQHTKEAKARSRQVTRTKREAKND